MSLFLLALIAAIASQILGWLWHGPWFGKQWARAVGMSEQAEDCKPGEMPSGFHWYLVINFVMNYFMAYATFYFLSSLNAFNDDTATIIGLLIYFGFMLPMTTMSVLWNGETVHQKRLQWMISIPYQFLNLFIWGLLFKWFV